MTDDKFWDLVNDNQYMICVFDKDDNIANKNKKFNRFFHKINNYSDFKNILVKNNVYEENDTMYVKSPDSDGIIKFEISKSGENMLAIGTKLNYDRIMSFFRLLENRYENADETKVINFGKNKLKTYCTFMVDDLWTIKYFSDNIYSLLNIENPYLRTVREVFGEDFFKKITDKIDYLDIFNDLCIEYEDKFVVITKSQYGYTIINIYPYSANVLNKFEEVTELKYKIEQLESELDRRKKLIDFQKDMIKDLSTKIQ